MGMRVGKGAVWLTFTRPTNVQRSTKEYKGRTNSNSPTEPNGSGGGGTGDGQPRVILTWSVQ